MYLETDSAKNAAWTHNDNSARLLMTVLNWDESMVFCASVRVSCRVESIWGVPRTA